MVSKVICASIAAVIAAGCGDLATDGSAGGGQSPTSTTSGPSTGGSGAEGGNGGATTSTPCVLDESTLDNVSFSRGKGR